MVFSAPLILTVFKTTLCGLFVTSIVVASSFIILTLYHPNQSARARRYRISSENPKNHVDKINIIKEAKKEAALTESGKKFNKKLKEWKLSIETHPQQVQRKQKQAPRAYHHKGFWSAGLNLEVLFWSIRLSVFSSFLCAVLVSNYFPSLTSYITLLMCVLAYVSAASSFKRLILKQMRFFWWRSWPKIVHQYVGGFIPVTFYWTLILVYFGIPISVVFPMFLIYLLYPAFGSNSFFGYLLLEYVDYIRYYVFWMYFLPFIEVTDPVSKYDITANFIKKWGYKLWCFLTPFLNERRRKGLIFYWTVF